MTDAQTALSRLAIACKGWQWMPGMLAYFEHDGRRVRVTDPACWVSTTALPDLTDAATLGCLLALVREAWGDPGMFARPRVGKVRPDWAVFAGQNSDIICAAPTEAEALVAALESAP